MLAVGAKLFIESEGESHLVGYPDFNDHFGSGKGLSAGVVEAGRLASFLFIIVTPRRLAEAYDERWSVTLSILSCMDCSRSVRVPTLIVVVIRGAPIA